MGQPSIIKLMHGKWILLFSIAALLTACVEHFPAVTVTTKMDEGKESDSVMMIDKKAFGIYQWNKDSTYDAGLQSEISAMGTSPTYAMYFVDKDMGFPKEIVHFNAKRNIRTVLSQELCRYSQKNDKHTLDSILAGKWDAYFHSFAKQHLFY